MRVLRNRVLAAIFFGSLLLNWDGGFNTSALTPTALLSSIFMSSAKAHGGGTERLVDEPIGPYRLFAWSNPEPLRVGDVHITMALTLPPDGEQPIDEATLFNELDEVVTGADIEVTFVFQPSSQSGDQLDVRGQLKTRAVAGSINPLFYEVDTELPFSGEWQVSIDIVGDLGGGTATFSTLVEEAQLVDWKLIGGAGVLLLLLVFTSRVRSTRASSTRARERGTKRQQKS